MDPIKSKRCFAIRNLKKLYLKTWSKYFFILIYICNSFLWANTFWIERNQTFLHIPINWTPPNAQQEIIYLESWKMILYSLSFSRGEIFYFEILPKEETIRENHLNTKHKLFYKTIRREIPLNKKNFGFNGIYVFPPELEQSKNEFEWHIEDDNHKFYKSFQLNINLRKFPFSDKPLVFEKKTLTKEEQKEIEERIQKEKILKNIAFSENLPLLLTNQLSHPRDIHYITSEWYKKRIHQYYQIIDKKRVYSKPYYSIHRGLDLKGNIGDIVFAIGDGKIVLSDNFYYEGNFILINHGNKIFSGYMHLNERYYPQNTYIKAGIPIGTVGATGLVTGAHLHFAIWIDGFVADPLSIFSLPIR